MRIFHFTNVTQLALGSTYSLAIASARSVMSSRFIQVSTVHSILLLSSAVFPGCVRALHLLRNWGLFPSWASRNDAARNMYGQDSVSSSVRFCGAHVQKLWVLSLLLIYLVEGITKPFSRVRLPCMFPSNCVEVRTTSLWRICMSSLSQTDSSHQEADLKCLVSRRLDLKCSEE